MIAELLPGVVCLLILLVPVGLGIWAVVAIVRHRQKVYRRKVAALHHWARAHGWAYQERDPSLANRFRGEPFGWGSSRTALHVFSGAYRDRRLFAFEYRYTVSSGKNSTTYRHTVVAIPTPSPRPYLQLGLEHAGHQLLELFGARDLQLESEEFNRVFRISTGNDKFAYDVLHPRMMQWLLADQRSRVVPFRFEDNALLCWTSGEIDPRHVIWMAAYLADVADRVPDFVWR